ncbi:MAG: S8 family serine peptidase [Planctomycetes bacterium]|nr:S8 family serine peptidase [Planctomycetota bacterium]
MVNSIHKSVIEVSKTWLSMLLFHACFLTCAVHAQTNTLPQSLSTVGVHALKALDPTLTGQGVRFAIVSPAATYHDGESRNDYGPNLAHRSLSNSDIALHDGVSAPAGISSHSTAVCSILFGQDEAGYQEEIGAFQYQGIAPAAQVDVYELLYFMGEVVLPQEAEPLVIISASCGWDFEDWYTRGIEALIEHEGVLAIASIGNGTDAFQAALYPGASANVIGVGVVDSVDSDSLGIRIAHFGLAHPEHSSCGPTDDDRSKPDLVAPGNCLAASADDAHSYDVTGSASSFAAPLVAGIAGLLVQKARQEPELSAAVSPHGGNCVMKALLMNSATKLPFWHKGELTLEDDHRVPLDYAQGAGMVNGLEAYLQLTAGRQAPGRVSDKGWDIDELSTAGQTAHIYALTVADPDEDYITATLVWNRHYEAAFPFQPLPGKNNDLALELWAVDANDPTRDMRIDYSDSRKDNVEHLYTKSLPGFTEYQLIVLLRHPVPSEGQEAGPSEEAWERYGIAWNTAAGHDEKDIRWHDLNSDGVVDAADVRLLEETMARRPWETRSTYTIGDVNTDGKVDMIDVEGLEAERDRRAAWYSERGAFRR